MPSKSTLLNPSRLSAAAATLLLGGLVAAVARAEPPMEPVDDTADAFVSLFNGTCVAFYGEPDKLRADLEGRKLPLVDDAHRTPFLHEDAGQAWSLSDDRGDFVIALRERGGCSVFARRAKDSDVQRLFAALVQQIQVPGAPITKIADKLDPSAVGETHYVAYARLRTTPGPYVRFSVATTASDKVAIQAVATVTTAVKR